MQGLQTQLFAGGGEGGAGRVATEVTGKRHGNQPTGQFTWTVTMWEWGPRGSTPRNFSSFKSGHFLSLHISTCEFIFFSKPTKIKQNLSVTFPIATEAIPMTVNSHPLAPLCVRFAKRRRLSTLFYSQFISTMSDFPLRL